MENFNMKQWLIENKAGMYNKTRINEEFEEESATADQMQNRDDLEERGGVREVGGHDKFSEMEFTANGKEYLADVHVNWWGKYDAEDNDIYDVQYDVEVEGLQKAEGDQYVPVGDTDEVLAVQNFLKNDSAMQDEILNMIDYSEGDDAYGDSDEYFDDYMEETVGYVMKTKFPK